MKETTEKPDEAKAKVEKEAPAYEVLIIDIFKKLLGYNYLAYGTKKKSL